MAKSKRKKFSAGEKVVILKKHLLEKKAVSDLPVRSTQTGLPVRDTQTGLPVRLCTQTGIFETKKDDSSMKMSRKIEELEKKLGRKNEVLSELMEDHIALKKVLGKVKWNLGSTRYTR